MKAKNDLPPELRSLVSHAVALLGDVIRSELGDASFERIERIRRRMAGLRGSSPAKARAVLLATYRELDALSGDQRLCFAHAYGLMLEVMNACENAYRTHRLARRAPATLKARPDAIVYVLTAHPTEARSPDNIMVFHAIQGALQSALARGFEREEERLRHLIEVVWRLSVSRRRKPSVADEAEHIYSILLRPETLSVLLETAREIAPFYVRTWVGGDKDGHPGVNARVMEESLRLSRARLVHFALERLDEVEAVLALLKERAPRGKCAKVRRDLEGLESLAGGDGARIVRLRKHLRELTHGYAKAVGEVHPALSQLTRLLHMFPGMVVALELRESSDIIMAAAGGEKAAITGMLKRLAELARGGHPTWYARGFIISMASTLEHVRAAAVLVRGAFGALRLPIIPLFEQRGALAVAPKVVESMLRTRDLRSAIDRHWSGYFEVMLGYSDSAKEVGVLPSRLAIAEAVQKLEALCRRHGVRPLFFHGSGGSVDRGGGSIQEQTAWWPKSALRLYKATIQGEMVERSFASPEIARGQLERIAACFAHAPAKAAKPTRAVFEFSELVREAYQAKIASPEFLEVVQKATAYRYLDALRIGSRPSKRGAIASVQSLRAIPWVLCWTQTRVLFPTWWGVGAAWDKLGNAERANLRRAFRDDPLFRSYVKLLGFTLAKVELPIWAIYLERSGLERSLARRTYDEFSAEYARAVKFVRALSGSSELLWFRPWLGTSIRLRAPMIHPLNLLQIITLEERSAALTRETVTGIASGMMTTG